MALLKQQTKAVKIAVAAVVVLAVIAGACAAYLGDYYRADMDAIVAFSAGNEVTMQVLPEGDRIWAPEETSTGLIFYPGGKVEHTAYIPLMQALSARGILCVLVEMPFRLAVFDVDAAAGIPEDFPQIEHWYIGGHSLGGSMAASYVSEHVSSFEGLVLLGSYSTADLSESDLSVLSIYGSEDRVLNREKYEQNKQNLTENFRETVIDGGCHAYFGMYGAQEGDGTPSITNREQIELTADAIAAMISGDEKLQ